MEPVTVSPKFQVVIPRRIRERMALKPGQKLQAFEAGGIIRFVPVLTMAEARGFLGKIDTTIEREPDRDT